MDGRFRGTYTALVTPFKDEAIDHAGMEALVERQIAAGIDGVVPCGSTGESATLSHAEQHELIQGVVLHVGGRCKVLAGTGSNCTDAAVAMTREAESSGADGALVVTPYYNRPTQEGLFRHYAAIAESTSLPIVLYNVPARCSVDLANETVLRLRERFRNIVAIKDASGGTDRVTELVTRSDIDVLSGDDEHTLAMMALGARGVISVMSNLAPAWMKSLVDAAAAGAFDSAREWHGRVAALIRAIGRLGPNPIPIKTALAVRGLIREEFRLPLCPMEARDRNVVVEALKRLEVPAG
ncbi:MAG: 4-hydroxy-tetrahydrodipicolinate synthase [Phycisphaerales bacterium]|nr:4-hydroxy-tetrahydrodipicolinate synthase [Phycisphaerales bacterium]